VNAAFLARDAGLGEEKVKEAAQKAYDVAYETGQIAKDLNQDYHAQLFFGNASMVASTFGLGEELIDKATKAQNTAIAYRIIRSEL
jgi:hypothetical protein